MANEYGRYEKQGVFYLFEIVASVLIGIFVWQSYGVYEGLFAGGLTIFGSMIINLFFFGEDLLIEPLVIFGLVSLITISIGTYFTFGLLIAICSIFGVLVCMFLMIYIARGYL